MGLRSWTELFRNVSVRLVGTGLGGSWVPIGVEVVFVHLTLQVIDRFDVQNRVVNSLAWVRSHACFGVAFIGGRCLGGRLLRARVFGL